MARETDTWPDFRGPRATGHSAAKNLPTEWSETKSVLWKSEVPEVGWSSPVVWGDQLWLTTATQDGKQQWALCYHRQTGALLRRILVFQNPEPQTVPPGNNTYASPSPVLESGSVYVHFGTSGTACIDTRRFTVRWTRRDLNCQHGQGPGSSPFLHKNRLILTYDGMDVQYVVALDPRTGKTLWKTTRSTPFGGIDGDLRKAYTTPIVVPWQGREQLVSVGARAFCSYDPESGKELWRIPHPGFSNASRPVFRDGLLFLNTGFNRPELWAIQLPKDRPPTEQDIVWRYTKGVPNLSSPILVGDLLYFVADSEVLTCLEATTGKEIFKERIGGRYYASPILVEGLLYLFAEDGRALVLKPTRALETVAQNRLLTGCHASPAPCGEALYLRTSTHLYCLSKSARATTRSAG